MTGHAVRRIGDQRYWSGVRDAWSPREADAATFGSAFLALFIATRDCPAAPDTYGIVPVFVDDAHADERLWRQAA